jgi:hypothetical protein
MCFDVGGLGWVSTWGLGKHVHSTTYPNCPSVFALTCNYICARTHAFNTYLHNNNNMGSIHSYFVKNQTFKSHQNWNMTKIKPKKNGKNVVFVHSNITFWITNKSNHFMPYFLIAIFYTHVKQATSNKNIHRSYPFSKL